ncbi:MAG TPA: hypothetical protein VFI20_10980 [Terracidiphilus sp.]|nr:hypothetical protein [Terracidiphilus sp.]
MRCIERLAILVCLSVLALPTWAHAADDNTPDAESIAALQAKISDAQPRDRCFLYARLIHQITEYSVQQHAAGDVTHTNILLKEVQTLAKKLHLTVSENDKRLKSTEILLRHSAFRLQELLHASSYDEQPLVEQTLTQVNKADDAAMMQLFQK